MEPRFRGGGGDIDKPDLLYNTASLCTVSRRILAPSPRPEITPRDNAFLDESRISHPTRKGGESRPEPNELILPVVVFQSHPGS